MSIDALNVHDFFNIALAVLSILSTVVGLIVATVALRISVDSNTIAARAVEISSFNHKKDVAPNLTFAWSPDESGSEVIFSLRNEARGKASIKSISSNFKKNLVFVKPHKLPIILLLNGVAIFTVDTKLDSASFQKESDRRELIKQVLSPSWFAFFYEDILGTKYKVVFKHNPVGSYFTPTVEELDPKYPRTQEYFES